MARRGEVSYSTLGPPGGESAKHMEFREKLLLPEIPNVEEFRNNMRSLIGTVRAEMESAIALPRLFGLAISRVVGRRGVPRIQKT